MYLNISHCSICVFLQDIEAEGNVKIEEPDYQDIEEEIPQSEILPTTSFIPKVKVEQ